MITKALAKTPAHQSQQTSDHNLISDKHSGDYSYVFSETHGVEGLSICGDGRASANVHRAVMCLNVQIKTPWHLPALVTRILSKSIWSLFK